MSRIRYARREGVVETGLPEELVLLDPMTQEMFSLDTVGAFIWRALDNATAEELTEAVVGAFEVERARAAADVQMLLDDLTAAALASWASCSW